MVTKKRNVNQFPNLLNAFSSLQKLSEINTDLSPKINQIMIDNDSIKKDTAYELFYIRKNDGSRFFNVKQLRSLKTANEVGEFIENNEKIIDLIECKDKLANLGATNILKSISSKINRFFQESTKSRKVELVKNINSSIMGLMLASHRTNRITNHPSKCCLDYYKDFQYYLYKTLQSKEYHKYLEYNSNENNSLVHSILDLIHALCKSYIMHFGNYQEVVPFIHEWISKKEFDSFYSKDFISKELINLYYSVKKNLKSYSHMPLKLILHDIEKGEANYYAPLKQGNYSFQLYSIYFQDKKCMNLQMAGPVHQDYIDNSSIDEVFLGYLRSIQRDQLLKKHLIVNLQDRTHWRESARSRAIENLEKDLSNNKYLNVITLPMDTDFYHQSSLYSNNDNFESFYDQFKMHIKDPSSGFYFSEEIKNSIFPSFCNDLGCAIHRVFFNDKAILSIEERKCFIDIYYFFLIIKVLELTHSDVFNLSCKDATDLGGSLNLIFFTLLKYLNNSHFNKGDLDLIFYFIFGKPMIHRERLLFKERAERYFNLLKYLEELKENYGEESFSILISEIIMPLYHTKLLHGQIVPAHLL